MPRLCLPLLALMLALPGRGAGPDDARLAGLMQQLTGEDFAAREKAHAELVAAGLNALPHLRAALGSPDLEARRRVQECIQGIEARPELAEPLAAAKVLLDARIATDGPGLLAFLKGRTPTADDQARLARAVKSLGDDNFDTREKATEDLLAAGRAAIPFLRAAQNDADLEVRRRVDRCLEALQTGEIAAQMSAAARLLAYHRPAGAADALFAYLPFAEDEQIEEAVFEALAAVSQEGAPLPAVRAAAADTKPIRRAAAAFVLGRAKAPDRDVLAKLLSDPEARVRYEAATALLRLGDRKAGPTAIALLTEAPLPLAWQTEDMLARIAGEQAPTAALGAGSDADRKKCRDAWAAWWRINGDRVDLARLTAAEPYHGLTLACEYDGVGGGGGGGRVAEYGRDGKIRWQIDGLSGVNDAQLLPGGRVLVAERNGNVVRELDRKGQTLWKFDAPGAIACARMPNGNTLVCTFGDLMEVTPDGKVVHSLKHASGYRHAIRLRNGHILFVSSAGEVVELGSDWQQIKLIRPEQHAGGAGYWASVEPLPNGRYLVALGGAGRVVEIDNGGRIVWQVEQPNCVFATRLRNGNTLVSNFEQKTLVEVDRAGKEVGKMTLQGRTFTIRRY
jgi:HEAT repeat protein